MSEGKDDSAWDRPGPGRLRFVWGDYSGAEPRLSAFSGWRGAVRADRPEQVRGALRKLEKAAAAGLYAAGFVAYEAAAGLDPALAVRGRSPGPLLFFGLYERHLACAPPPAAAYRLGPWRASLDTGAYGAKLESIRRRIAAGDTYQVNFTWRQTARFAGDERAFFDDLCRAQRAAYCAYMAWGGRRVLSASPELFFEARDGVLTARPMKGTRPRGRWPAEDRARARALRRSAKDRAENAMIVDLLRNDIGRVARTGTVDVPDMWQVEGFPTVWQMTSTVRARLRREVGLADLFTALFPCGSVTGAPKVSTMRIIRGLEGSPRGIYTGSVGYIEPGGAMRFNVAIRTVALDGARATYGVGSGVTWASSAAGEYREGQAKARVLSVRRPPFDLLETLLFEEGKGVFLRRRHLERLRESAVYFGYPFDPGAVERALDEAVEGQKGAWRVRLLLDPAGAVRVERYALKRRRGPLRAGLAPTAVDPRDPLLYHKTTRRGLYEDALEALPGCDEAVLRNRRGELTECCTGNLVLEIGGRRWTPPLRCGLLPGTWRAELLESGKIDEKVLRRSDLKRAERAYMINSVRRWTRLRLMGI